MIFLVVAIAMISIVFIYFLPRTIDFTIFKDARFLMFNEWLSALIASPLERVSATTTMIAIKLPWFHNFIADVQRLSGSIPLVLSILLFLYILIRVFALRKICVAVFVPLVLIYVSCISIISTSVVPEGEIQFWLLIVTIGGIAERLHSLYLITTTTFKVKL